MKTAVVFINMGGPESGAEVKGFIKKLFLDPHIISAPALIRKLLACFISTIRAPKIREHYRAIGGGSPLKRWTTKQAESVQAKLNDKFEQFSIQTAYSYSSPLISEKLSKLMQEKYDKIIVLPLYPQFSNATLGSIYDDLAQANKKLNIGHKLTTLPPFYEEPGYIQASAGMLISALEKIDQKKPYHVVFTAHALPESLIKKGDPYGRQIAQTVFKILEKHPLENYTIAFQSKIGPIKWMQPSTVDTIRELGKQGIGQVVVVPIGFVCDHIETLYELDIELCEIAVKAGIDTFVRADVFNDNEMFIDFLAEYIERVLS